MVGLKNLRGSLMKEKKNKKKQKKKQDEYFGNIHSPVWL